MLRIIIPAILIMLMASCVPVTPAQQIQPRIAVDDLTKEQRDALAEQERARLRKLEFRIEPVSERHGEPQSQFNVGEKIGFRIMAKFAGPETFDFCYSRYYTQYKPVLVRNGEEVTYSPRGIKLLREFNSTEPLGKDSCTSKLLLPGQEAPVGFFSLDKWYAPLDAGSYQVKLVYGMYQRFVDIESDEVDFEIVSTDIN